MWGGSYIPMLFETIGFALVVVAGLSSLSAFQRRWVVPLAYGSAFTLGVLIALTTAANWQLVWGA